MDILHITITSYYIFFFFFVINMFAVRLHKNISCEQMKLWVNHYNKIKIKFKIFDETEHISDDFTLITFNDFIFRYSKNVDDVMELFTHNCDTIFDKSAIIGKVFYVPTNEKQFTTFEIPDFITYKHSSHTNYTVHGINVNDGDTVSDEFVCLSLDVSAVANKHVYYKTDILICDEKPTFKYHNFKHHNFKHPNNIFVCKEHMYAFVTFAKCASSTYSSLFAKLNNIKIDDSHMIAMKYKKYAYNVYLQNIQYYAFVRNPYERFISCYFNKHVNIDKYYTDTPEYKKYISYCKNTKDCHDNIDNLINYLCEQNTIDGHTDPIYNNFYDKLKNINIYHIEDKTQCIIEDIKKNHNIQILNSEIYNFNKTNIDIIKQDQKIDSRFKKYNKEQWIEYYNVHGCFPHYSMIIDNKLSEKIFKFYEKDFIFGKYNKKYIPSESIYINVPSDFDWEFYVKFNKDLSYLTKSEAYAHYNTCGYIENRIYKLTDKNFDWKSYILVNKDLAHMTKYEATTHYELYGIKEGRKY